ncbi:MAG: site-2 protease family protein [Thermodesulfobacteriota bacterium]|nr:site-2 protease family protein [Thermodesulfobacteriota bacterium]
MFGKRITLFKLLGFEIKIDVSWVIIAVLVTWSLALGLFPQYYKNLPKATYWWMGVAGALGLFVSIIFHELCHSLVARRYGLRMKGITLFIFGGVAEMDEEPPSAKAEFMMAVAGPFSSVLLGAVFYGVLVLGKESGWPTPINGVIAYLAFINGILAGFNLLPAFPLDGGRMLRSSLWGWKKNLRWATRVASQIGSAFGMVMILLGILNVFFENFIGGIWWFMIGVFMQNAARSSYQQILTRQAFEGEKVRRFMKPDIVTVSPSISIARLVEDYIYRHHYKMFPVIENGRLKGCVNVQQVKEVPQQEWQQHTVSELMRQCSPENTIGPEADALKALSIMSRTQNSRLMVVEGDRLIGIVSLKDMLNLLSLKMDLEGYEGKD